MSEQMDLAKQRFPRSGQYDLDWIIENQMGLNPLWLTEWVCQLLDLIPGMRILDLGCGKALSSIFLAKEFDLEVWSTDLWISATDNLKRIQAAKATEMVIPIHADARSLPFAQDFFDAILCIDSYIYFGTDDLYLDYLHKFVKPGGKIAIAVPGFMQPLAGPLPEHLGPFWAQECWTWHTVDWWREHWSRTGLVEIECADTLPNGWELWQQWKKARLAACLQKNGDPTSLQTDIRALEMDQGRYMGFIRMIAKKLS